MRILVLSYEYPPIGGGGGRVAQDICRVLCQRGHAVTILTAHYGDLPREELQNGARVVRLVSGRKEPYRAGLVAMGGYIWASFWAGLKLIRVEKPDILHAHFAVPTGAAAWLLSKATGVPYVLTAHLGDVPGGVPEKTGRWFRWIYPFTPPIWKDAARVAAVSQFTRDLARKAYPVDPLVIPNGVDLSVLDPGEIHLNSPVRLIFAGRFMPQKNPVGLVRILGRITDLAWECVLVGDGPLRGEVEAEIDRLGLTERIRLTGWLSPEGALDWMRRSDILLMPSLSEGLSVVGVQALALGLALAVSRAGGFPELVKPGENGFLADAEDEGAFELGLRALLGDPQALLRQRQASRAQALRFDLQGVVSTYERLLRESVRNAHGKRVGL